MMKEKLHKRSRS